MSADNSMLKDTAVDTARPDREDARSVDSDERYLVSE
jgi:hypothetical protein